jgi:hypothetical protein
MKTHRFYVWLSDKAEGPFTLDQLRGMWRIGRVNALTQVCIEGDQEWTPLEWMEEQLNSKPPTLPPEKSKAVPQTKEALAIALCIGVVGLVFLFTSNTSKRPTSPAKAAPVQAKVDVPYINETGIITGGFWFGSTSKEFLEKGRGMMQAKDNDALARLVEIGLQTGTAIVLNPGEEVTVVDYSIMASTLKVRRRGEVQDYWTFMPAVRKAKPE